MAIFNSNYEGLTESVGSYNFEFGGAQDIAMESYEDELAVIEAIHAYDMAEIEGTRALTESYGSEEEFSSVMEGKLADVWDRIKAFFKKIFDRIKNFFMNIINNIRALFMSYKDFASKFKNKINSDFKAEVDTYERYVNANINLGELEDIQGKYNKYLDDAISFIERVDKEEPSEDEIEKHLYESDKFRYFMVTGATNSTYSADEYTEKLLDTFRGEKKITEINSSAVSKYFDFLSKTDNVIKKAENSKNKIAQRQKEVDNKVEKAKKESMAARKEDSKKTDIGTKMWSKVATNASSVSSIYASACSAFIKCVKECASFQKSVCMRAIKK